MFLVAQLVYLWVGYVLLLLVEVTLDFLEMAVQHLQPVVLQGIEWYCLGSVYFMVIGVFDFGGLDIV